VIAHKFIGYEFDYLNKNDDNYSKKLTIIWCIKESLYKLFTTPGLSFLNHTLVIPFMLQDKKTITWIDYLDKKYRFNATFLEFEGFSCAFVI
jgi:4'-phosphopantetheinyl transferase EntD